MESKSAAASGWQSVQPLFIIGAPRSGTSVMTWILGQHPNIQPMPETAWIAQMAVDSYRAYQTGTARARFSHLSNVEYSVEPFMARMGEAINKIVCDVFEERCRRLYGDWRAKGAVRWNPANPNAAMQIRRSVDDPKERWVDGTPMNTPYAWGLSVLFPGAKFLHLIRRPESVASSLMNFENVGAVSQDADAGLKTWIDHTHYAMLAARAFGPDVVRTLKYEELISNPEITVRSLLDFLGEYYSDDCLIPLQNRINSSDVDDRRQELISIVKSQPHYSIAHELYEKSLTTVVSDELANAARSELKDFFLNKCKTVSM